MTAMYLLIAFSLLIATGFVLAFVWAIRTGQFDDKFTPSIRVLFDDETIKKSTDSSSTSTLKGDGAHPKTQKHSDQ
jgi:cbb3-type cytochrome oxidase maturation protein